MPIQYAGGTNVNNTFTQSGSATRREIVDGIVTELGTAGWSTISGGGTGDVLLESATTPAGLKMRVRVLDPGSGNCAQVKVRNASNSISQSSAMFLVPGNGKTWRVIANKYQCFVFVPGTSASREYAAWGVPYTSDSNITTCFWAQGNAQSDTDTTVRPTFRTVLHTTFNFNCPISVCCVNDGWWENPANTNFSYLFGGSQYLLIPSTAIGNHISSAGYRWHDGNALIVEPLLSFGSVSSSDEGKVRGQLWDAFLTTEAYAVDTTLSGVDSKNWWCLTNNNTGAARGSLRGSLFLMTP